MKNHFLIFVAALSVSCTSLSKDKKINLKPVSNDTSQTFKSNNGFEIEYPDCMEVSASYVDDMEKKVGDVDSITILENKKKCRPKDTERGLGIEKYFSNDAKDSPLSRLKKYHESTERNKARSSGEQLMNRLNSDSLISIYTPSTKANDTIYWEIFKPCGNDLYLFRMVRHATSATPTLIAAIKKGDPSIPELERKIIDSFKCLRKEAK